MKIVLFLWKETIKWREVYLYDILFHEIVPSVTLVHSDSHSKGLLFDLIATL